MSNKKEPSSALCSGALFGGLTLDELCDALLPFRGNCDVTQREHGDGTSEAILEVDGALRASWRGRLKNAPVYDGKAPRGPKEYYDLQFFQPNNSIGGSAANDKP
jgi:hypothetical protein